MSVLRPEFPDHSSPFSRKQERRRKLDAIVSAAAQRFNEQGFAHTRLEDVAADLGLTKTSISYYFASKEDLAEAVFRAAAEFLHDAVNSARAAPGDPADRIQALVSAYAAQLGEAARGRRAHLAALRDLEALPDGVRDQIAGRMSEAVALINALVTDWIGHARAPVRRPEPVTVLILELLDWLAERQGGAGKGGDISAAGTALADLLDHGLTAAGAAAAGAAAPLDLTSDETLAIFDRDARNRMKREAFLKAGSRLFNQKGFGGASLAEVASALGVSRGAFYYHIQDKEQFLDQCLDRSLHIVERALSLAEAAELSALGRVRSVLVELVYRQAAGVEPLIRPGMAAVLPPPRRRRYQSRMRNIALRLGDALAEGVETGEIRALDTGLIEEILAGAVFLNGGYTLAAATRISGWSLAEDPRSASNDYLHLILYGLKGPA
ncbi:TetR/AcrR family transcriptional regulator [Hyphomonadaceae bacterium ML37]|nr:TetR/AcrR family transcriptional regulator [Hyphomonadaceae bacterium ML37]